MFIHWGPYSLASVEASWPIMTPKPGGIAEAEYVELPKRFNPEKFDARALVELARSAGQQYMVFTTKHPGEEDTVWILTHLDPARHEITYVAVTSASRAGIIQIACANEAAGGSRAQVTYTFTALGPAGSAYIQSFTEESYARRTTAWEHALRYYLETGRRFRHHE